MKIILWLCVAAAIGVYITGPVTDPDLWWHITVGKWILAHESVPSVDYWNRFGVGDPWRAYSWSNEILLALVDGSWGAHGLLTAQLLLALLVAGAFSGVMSGLAKDWFVGLALGILATSACFNHFTLRPQSLVWVLLVCVLSVAASIGDKGWSLGRAAALVALMSVWANSHITTALGLFAAMLWALPPKPKSIVALYRGLQVGCVGFLGTLLTPYFGGEWLTFFSKTSHPFALRLISEFQPATIMQYSTAFVVVIAALLGALLSARPQNMHFPRLAVAVLFTIGGLAVVKFLPFGVIALCAAIASLWGVAHENNQRGRPFGNLSDALEKLRAGINWIQPQGPAFLLICLMIVDLYALWKEPVSTLRTAITSVDFIEQNHLPHPLMNDFGRGGYVMYRYSNPDGTPQRLVSIDGRTNIGPHEMWTKYVAAEMGAWNWREYLKLVDPETILWRSSSAFVQLLIASNQWCVVSGSVSDPDGFSVLVKREYFEQHQDTLHSENCGPNGAGIGSQVPSMSSPRV